MRNGCLLPDPAPPICPACGATEGDQCRIDRPRVEPVAVAGDLREALEALHDFRQFWQDNVTQAFSGAGHHNPMWARIAELLSKHGMNSGPGGASAYFRPDPAYRPESRLFT